jgi:NAD(P)-dependent dehydrogenase (short-subunit alcohol dehydrogenase family)
LQLNNKICVVTGASSGIGRETALALAAQGAVICAAARREELLRSLTAECSGSGHSYVVTDVSQRDQVRRLADHVGRTHGRCDVLVNNAGFGGRHLSLDDPAAVADVDALMRTNFLGAVLCTAELLPLLEAGAPSSVVNVASIAGRIAVPGSSAYNASKFALVGWSEALHYELAGKGINVSLVEPGLIPTEGWPQSGLVNHPVLHLVLGSQEQVAAAIVEAITTRRFERTVPRWYYLPRIPHVLTPRLYRYALRKVTARYSHLTRR